MWDRSDGLPLLLSDATNSYVYGPGDVPLEQIDGSRVVTYYHHDELGSTRLLTTARGAASATFTYAPYGTQIGRTGTQTTPLGFAGQYTDAESGLQYLRARYYDPGTGQFLTRDPLSATTGQPYGYAGGDPLSATDPSGLLPSLSEIATRYVGWVDAMSGDITAGVRDQLGWNGGLDKCSLDYRAFHLGGSIFSVPAMVYEGPAAAAGIEEGIYVIRGLRGTYVGQSGNITRRLAQHVGGGIFTREELAAAEHIAVSGGKTAREIAEQKAIDDMGGTDILLNRRNPVGPGRSGLMPQPYSRP